MSLHDQLHLIIDWKLQKNKIFQPYPKLCIIKSAHTFFLKLIVVGLQVLELELVPVELQVIL